MCIAELSHDAYQFEMEKRWWYERQGRGCATAVLHTKGMIRDYPVFMKLWTFSLPQICLTVLSLESIKLYPQLSAHDKVNMLTQITLKENPTHATDGSAWFETIKVNEYTGDLL